MHQEPQPTPTVPRGVPHRTSQAPQLIAYADRFGGTIAGLHALLSGPLAEAFGGVHLLPFYLPFDGVDAGFDPSDHTEIDPRLGGWDDLRALSREFSVTTDLIVNHMSDEARQFRDVVALGDDSAYAGMFLTMAAVFPDGATEEEISRIYRPSPGLPFTLLGLGGRARMVWTTFSNRQIDLNIHHPATWEYLRTIIDRLTSAGVDCLRLDAIGYVGKQAGTNCFLTDDCRAFIRRVSDYAHTRGARILIEVHGHYRQQADIAPDVDLVYDFALPPLVLHALYAHDPAPLGRWLSQRPHNAVTVLDTHDGIGIIDAGPNALMPAQPGLLTAAQTGNLVESIHAAGGETSRAATAAPIAGMELHQVNCTFYDALGADDDRYLLARLIQLFVPGIPQIYYVGLLAGHNDTDLLRKTGEGREVNRHYYTPAEIAAQLERPVVRSLLAALRLRSSHPAFEGTFTSRVEGTRIVLRWDADAAAAVLDADVATGVWSVVTEGGDGRAFDAVSRVGVTR